MSKKSPDASAHKQPLFVIQQHDARSLHYDFRLESNGVLISWAVPKGPSTNPAAKQLALRTDNHPLEYATFEGVIPEGQYGAGPVIVWDIGTYRNLKDMPLAECLENGELTVWLEGKKVHGGYALVKTAYKDADNSWLLIKMDDDKADRRRDIIKELPNSVLSGRSIAQVTP